MLPFLLLDICFAVVCGPPPPSSSPAAAAPADIVANTTQLPAGASPLPYSNAPAPPAPPRNSTGAANPFVGSAMYVDPEFTAKVETSIPKLPPALKTMAEKVKMQSTAIWLDTTANLKRVDIALPAASKQAAANGPTTVTFVVYNLPGRDCNALASNGEIPTGSFANYTAYIDSLKQKLTTTPVHSNLKIVLIIEPDSLPNLATNLENPRCKAAEKEYNDGIAYAIATLSLPNTYLYLDSAHGGWLGWPKNIEKIVPIYKKVVDAAKAKNSQAGLTGFVTNTANYSPTKSTKAPTLNGTLENNLFEGNPAIDELTFTSLLATAFQTAGLPSNFLIDTSRNGVAPARQKWGSWCNLKLAGLGQFPTIEPSPTIHAYVWVKPPGDSDGISSKVTPTSRLDAFCDPTTVNGTDSMTGAPEAGVWFHEHFQVLLQNAGKNATSV